MSLQEPLRIAHLTDWFLPRLGGLELHVRDLADRLARAGHRVSVLTATPADPDAQGRLQTTTMAAPEAVEVRRLPGPLVPGLRTLLPPWSLRAAAKALDDLDPHVVHVHASIGSLLALGGGWVAHERGLPLVVTFHSIPGAYGTIYTAFDRAVGWSGWPEVLAGVSSRVAREVGALLPDRHVGVLPNGIDAAWWREAAGDGVPGDARRGPGSTSAFRVASVMRLQARKRGAAVLEAVAVARERLGGDRPLHLTVVGDGPERARLEALARSLGIAADVTFTGYLPRPGVREVLRGADAFLLGSELESFGLSVLEARAAGVPVVARAGSGVAELVEDGVHGLLADDDAGLAEGLARMAADPDLHHRLRGAVRADPVPFDWPGVVERHLAVYEEARVRRRGGAAVGADGLPAATR